MEINFASLSSLIVPAFLWSLWLVTHFPRGFEDPSSAGKYKEMSAYWITLSYSIDESNQKLKNVPEFVLPMTRREIITCLIFTKAKPLCGIADSHFDDAFCFASDICSALNSIASRRMKDVRGEREWVFECNVVRCDNDLYGTVSRIQ